MSKIVWNNLKLSPAVLGAVILVANAASAAGVSANDSDRANSSPSNNSVLAQVPAAGNGAVNQESSNTLDRINQYSQRKNSLSQVTSVSQLRDVQPTDWAFQALQSLVERYGCIEGYPDRTYRGNRAMTRYEFAAGLNACLEQIVKLIPTGGGNTGGGVTEEDLAAIRRLQEEFRAELTTLRGRVDSLETRTTRLEAQQFSTTTKLRGEAIFAIAGAAGEGRAVASGQNRIGEDVEENFIFANRVRLNFDTSFTGKDRLRTRLQARNVTQFSGNLTGTNMSRLGFDGNDDNDVNLHRLEYRFPLTPRTNVFIEATGGEFNDTMYTFNPLFEVASQGSISRFGRFNPIYRLTDGGTGITLTHDLSKQFGIAVGYQVPRDRANNPNPGFGLINSGYSAIAQLSYRPSNRFGVGFTYARSYFNQESGISLSGGTGSTFANQPFGNIATSADHFSVQGTFRLTPGIVLSGWGGYAKASQEAGGDADASIWNYAVTLGLADFGKRGNLLGFVAGQPPKVTDNDITTREDRGTSYHLEAFYRIQVSDNISITPGAFMILNPEHNDDNNTIYVGTIRTTFTF